MQLANALFVRSPALSASDCLFENGSDVTARAGGAVRRRSGVRKVRRNQVSNVSYKGEKYDPEEASQVTAYVIVFDEC